MNAPVPPTRRRSLLSLGLVIALAVGATALWQRHRNATLGAEIAGLARPGDLALYSATWCGWCTRAKRMLDAGGVHYTVCEIDLDADCKARFDAIAHKLGRSATPIVVVRGEPQLGFDAARVLDRLRGTEGGAGDKHS
ncbi:glutaredoxin family protein [Rivibacter subsaxonicus]|uniref:Glutaredoxin n=1 Tax=Rivibacter subsaxonicus TaxID=457575 RepID=A0A4Q7W101_9BURK|nr:glutaredoxin domain-containing protein [Rivibacter subsaxonicus]RZU02515.1 glutaredoxin [Rivibacter subsaxonicus]